MARLTRNRVRECTILSFILAAVVVQFKYTSFLRSSTLSLPAASREANETTSNDEPSKNNSYGLPSSFSIPPYTYFILLCLQCGCQPILVKLYMPDTVVRSTCVLAQEGAKLIISLGFLVCSGNFSKATQAWTPTSALLAAGVPATLFAIQNYANLMANQTLPPVTFSVLNQTKILSTAWCCFLLMGQKQSHLQLVALVVLVFATLIIQKIVPLNCPVVVVDDSKPKEMENDIDNLEMSDNINTEESSSSSSPLKTKAKEIKEHASMIEEPKAAVTSSPEDEAARQLTMGVLPALFASFLSGLAGTLSQKTLQLYHRSPHLFNMELAVFSSSFLILTLVLGAPDCQKIKQGGATQGWTWKTWIPIVTSSLGAILVGLVTLHQGAVVKGFAMIFGIAILGILQQLTFGQKGGGVTKEQFVGGCVGAFSLWMHASFPAEKTS